MTFIRSIVTMILTWEARLILKKYTPFIVAVTGSVGKTTTKDAIYTVLSKDRDTRKSDKSLNSELGIPLTIIGAESGWWNPISWLTIMWKGLLLIILPTRYPEVLVLEVGADHPSDVRRAAVWLKPHIAVITGIPEIPAHVEFFDSPDAVVKEKKELALHVRSGGSVILNGDDERTRAMHSEFRATAVRYGLTAGNEFTASHESVVYQQDAPRGMRFRVDHSGSSVPITIMGALGRTHILPSLAACAVADAMGIDLVAAGGALLSHEPGPGRMRVIEGLGGSTIIDDTYNASPAAVAAALQTLHELETGGRKIALLGDMLELGKYSNAAHDAVGAQASGIVSELVTVGTEAARIAESARNAGLNPDRIVEYKRGESLAAGEACAKQIREGDVILVKGSQGIRMERAVKALMAEPHRAKELLVRQSDEWLALP